MKLAQVVKHSLACLALSAVVGGAQAQLSIEITGSGAKGIPIVINDFSGERIISQALGSVIRNDLTYSGMFRLIEGNSSLTETSSIDYADWRNRGADALVVGTVGAGAGGRYETAFRLHDVQKQGVLASQSYAHSSSQVRTVAHRIADVIYEKLTGERGVFSTRVSYVVKSKGRYQLQVADADGGNAHTALVSREPIISPVWSPDGSKIAYVSFEKKKPVVFVHEVASGRRHVVANFKGSNSAPAWSPDGRRMAVVLTKDGISQLYMINADGSGLTRLTSSGAIDTEPSFSPDGRSIYFTSDRGGSPQIYRIASSGGAAQRVTFEGHYNTSARLSPDGKSMAYIARNGGRFQLTIMDLASKQTQILTDSSKDESPSFAPNSRMIIYATEIGGRGVLSAVSSDGRIKQRLSVKAADVREPSWGPFVK